MVELVVSPSALQAGDAALVNRGGNPAMVTLGDAAPLNVGTGAGTVAAGDDARMSDAREWTATTIGAAEAEAGTNTVRRAWTAQRVRQAIVAWWDTSAFATKLAGIATGATANSPDATLLNRANHTGTQEITSTTTGTLGMARGGTGLAAVPANTFIYTTANDTPTTAPITALGRDVLAQSTPGAARSVLDAGGPNMPGIPSTFYIVAPRGAFFPNTDTGEVTWNMTAGQAIMVPAYIPRAGTISRLATNLLTDVSGNVRMFIYANNNGTPAGGSLVYGSGNVSSAGGGVKAFSPNVAVPEGWIWIGLHSSNTVRPASGSFFSWQGVGASPNEFQVLPVTPSFSQTFGALPSTCPAVTWVSPQAFFLPAFSLRLT